MQAIASFVSILLKRDATVEIEGRTYHLFRTKDHWISRRDSARACYVDCCSRLQSGEEVTVRVGHKEMLLVYCIDSVKKP